MPAHAPEQIVQIMQFLQEPFRCRNPQGLRTAKRKGAEALFDPQGAVEIAFDGGESGMAAAHKL